MMVFVLLCNRLQQIEFRSMLRFLFILANESNNIYNNNNNNNNIIFIEGAQLAKAVFSGALMH